MSVASVPGVRFEAVRPRSSPSVLRSDVAGFVGSTHRGPVGRAVRVEGWREYQREFGGLQRCAKMTYAVHGYFENGGQVAYIDRVVGADDAVRRGLWQIAKTVSAEERLSTPAEFLPLEPDPKDASANYTAAFLANAPGVWAEGLTIQVELEVIDQETIELWMAAGTKSGERERFSIELSLRSIPGRRPDPEKLSEVWQKLADIVAGQSRLFRLEPGCPLFPWALSTQFPGFIWETVLAAGSSCRQPGPVDLLNEYVAGLNRLRDEPEPALIAFPDLQGRVPEAAYRDFLESAAEAAAGGQDRMIVADPPAEPFESRAPEVRRSIALYAPRLRMLDPLKTGGETISVSATGHVVGAMARVDRERGAHYSPANVALLDAVDLEEPPLAEETSSQQTSSRTSAHATSDYVNCIRSIRGKGLFIWGSRTLDESDAGKFVAHRRFIHRLVRAIRRLAQPLVFERNGAELRGMIVRGITTTLLEAFRGGALLGARPDEAFFVRCDDRIGREDGQVVCDVGLALAAPMEYITIRVALSREGELEVFES